MLQALLVVVVELSMVQRDRLSGRGKTTDTKVDVRHLLNSLGESCLLHEQNEERRIGDKQKGIDRRKHASTPSTSSKG